MSVPARRLRAWVFRLRAWLGRHRRDRDFARELASHLDLHVADNLRSGMTPEEARRAALIALGGLEALREEHRDQAGLAWMDRLVQDVRYGLRSLAHAPGFVVAAVSVLALGIGANTAIFSVVNAVVLRPLPLRGDSRVAVIWITDPAHGRSRVGPAGVDFLDWTQQETPFEDLFLFEHGSGTVTGTGEPEQVTGLRVTTNFAEFLGVRPLLGRAFEPADRTRNVMLLSVGYWQGRFNGDPGIVGRALTLNSEQYTVIGVLPADATFWYPADVVVPWPLDRLRTADSDLGVFGRLRPSVRFASAQVAMDALATREAQAHPATRTGWGITVVPIREVTTQYIRPALLILAGAVGFVLLIACANVANLLVVRTLGRRREIAVRTALGASRGRLAQQFLVESLLLGLGGGILGVLAAAWGTAALSRILPASIPVPAAASQAPLPQGDFDAVVFTFALLISIGVSLVASLGPVWAGLRREPLDDLKDGARGTGSRANTPRGVLVVLETALAISLLAGAGLTIKSFWNLLMVRPGFTPDHLVTVQLKFANDAVNAKYRQPEARTAAIGQFLDQVRVIPGVESASFAMIVPLSQDDQDVGGVVAIGARGEPPIDQATSQIRIVTPGYFATLGIPLRAGRTFNDRDAAGSSRVVIVDDAFVRSFFPGRDPIGAHVQIPDVTRPPREVIGVVGSVADDGLDKAPQPTLYIPYAQAPAQAMTLVVRTAVDPGTILPAVKRAVWRVDPDQPLFNVRRMDDIVANTISARRVAFVLLALFAMLALVLAAVGIYSVTAYGVRQRTREIGVRMALGARPADVLGLIISGGMRQALIGMVLGLAGAALISRTLANLLYGVTPLDPLTFLATGTVFVFVALAANAVPAWRACRTRPVDALIEH